MMRQSKTSPSTGARSASSPRQHRRREQTRDRLLSGAFSVFSEHGLAHATVEAITEAADVGFGSFFNYFSSKQAAFDAVKETYLYAFGARLDRIGETVKDPAEIVAASTRHFFVRAVSDERFAKFASVALGSARPLDDPMVQRLGRDIAFGVEAGRFVVDDPVGVLAAVLGASHGFLQGLAHGVIDDTAPERIATIVLVLLGVDREEARAVANRPLPPLPPDPTVT